MTRMLAQIPLDPFSELRDIHLPPAPPLWPPAPGWWLLAAIALIAIALAARLLWHAWRRGRGRRAAMRALARLRERHRGGESAAAITVELSALLRRAAMIRHPRERVAGLTGRDWLAFLDDDQYRFSEGVGACLATAPYARSTNADVDALLTLCETWLRRNA